MYSILLHVSGIAILEIYFYFYYIGPMETVIFTHKVLDMVDTQKHDLILPEPLYIPYNQTAYHYFQMKTKPSRNVTTRTMLYLERLFRIGRY